MVHQLILVLVTLNHRFFILSQNNVKLAFSTTIPFLKNNSIGLSHFIFFHLNQQMESFAHRSMEQCVFCKISQSFHRNCCVLKTMGKSSSPHWQQLLFTLTVRRSPSSFYESTHIFSTPIFITSELHRVSIHDYVLASTILIILL